MPALPHPRWPSATRATLACVALLALPACREDAARQAWRKTAAVRVSLARVARDQPWSPCPLPASVEQIGPIRCGDSQPQRDERASALAQASMPTGGQAGAASRGLTLFTEVQWAAVSADAAARAERALDDSLRARPGDATLLGWLTVVRIARAGQTQSLSDLLRALDAAERAHRAAPASPAAVFNLAVVQERLHLVSSAMRSFESAAGLESDPDWRTEALARAAALRTVVHPVWETLPPDSAIARGTAVPDAQLRARASQSSAWRRELAFLALGEWGRAVTAAATRDSETALSMAMRLAEIERAVSSERSVSRVVQHIADVRTDSLRLRRLAAAHQTFTTALTAYRRGAFEMAQPLFQNAAVQFREGRSPMEPWAMLYRGYCLSNVGEYDAALALYAAVRAVADRTSQPALRARTAISIGTVRARTSRSEAAEQSYRRALPDLTAVRDTEALGQVAFLISEVTLTEGRRFESQSESLRSVRLLAPYRFSSYLQSEIAQLARLARTERLPDAALGIMRETLAISSVVARPNDMALAHADRARDLAALGADSAAVAEADSAAFWARQLQPGSSSTRLRALVSLSRGVVLRKHAPAQSLQVLLEATDALRPYTAELFLPNALHESAMSARATANDSLAERLLDEAMLRLDEQYDSYRSSGRRAAFGETVEKVYDTAMSLALDAQRGDRALALLERGKVASWHAGQRRGTIDAQGGVPQLLRMLPAQTTLVEYAVLPDRVAIWAISRAGVRLTVRAVSRDSLRGMVDALASELRSEGTVSASSARARLYDLLVRSAFDPVPGDSRVIVVPDRELFRVPFAALWDTRRGQNAIEQLEFRSSPSAAFAIRSLQRQVQISGDARVLAVGYDARGLPRDGALQPLTHSEAEARAIRTMFSDGALLTGDAAVRTRLLRELPRTTVLHFAGHAVFDEERPELSYLLLAARDRNTGDRYSAGEIASRGPSDLQLVVLSSCRSLGARDTRMGPVTGLAFSFLESGASGIVSTIWDISDAAANPVTTRFHRNLRGGASPAAALRSAQLDAMRSQDSHLRSATTWAAFTLSGT